MSEAINYLCFSSAASREARSGQFFTMNRDVVVNPRKQLRGVLYEYKQRSNHRGV